MNHHLPFKRSCTRLLAALVSAAFAGQTSAAAGRVDFVTGGTTVAGPDGRQRPLAKGTDLDKGDTVRTDVVGRAQIRFTDGSYVSLQPNTEFAIKDYNFEGKTDGSERGIFGLARGAMRTVTGLIGRVNRNRYQVATPTATIGIRGTGGLISIGADGSTLVNGTSGIWTLTNPSGTIDVPAGVSGKAPNAPSQPPQQTTEKPSTGPAQPSTTVTPYTQGDQVTSSGDPAALCGSGLVTNCTTTSTTPANANPPLTSGSGYHVSYSYGGLSGAGAPLFGINSSGTLANATFDAIGKMTAFTATNSASFTGSSPDFGTAGGVVAWGRWTGPMTVVDNSPGPGTVNFGSPLNANQGFHYVVGIPTAAMPTSGGPAAYTLVGATRATGTDGSIGLGTFTGTMNVTFGPTGGTLALTATIAFSTVSYNFASGSASYSSGSPAFTGSMTGTSSGTPGSYQCSGGGCTATVNGAFFGTGAAYAGYAYKVSNTNGGQQVTGAAVFKQP